MSKHGNSKKEMMNGFRRSSRSITSRSKKNINYNESSDSGSEQAIKSDPKAANKKNTARPKGRSGQNSHSTKHKRVTSSSSEDNGSDVQHVAIINPQKSGTRGKGTNNAPKRSKKSRSRILSESSSSSDAEDDGENPSSKIKTSKKSQKRKKRLKGKERNLGRKKIKKIIEEKDLLQETKEAAKEEKERLKRLKTREQLSQSQELIDGSDDIEVSSKGDATKVSVILQKDPLIEVSPYIAQFLRPHQVEGVKFIWDNVVESTERAKSSPGGGCILAHCMGLGKTLQTIACVHTFLKCEYLPFKCVMVVVPLNTVLNWVEEFVHWTEDGDELLLYNLSICKSIKSRIVMLKAWRKNGGVLICGYDMFRIMVTRTKYVGFRNTVKECMLDPGPDLIVCDEGHMLKNSESHISSKMKLIKTRRRIILTGTPLQNNLIEYHCMVNFVKPGLLGSSKEFRNRFVNPIENGQHKDSTEIDVIVMKKRAHVLHEMLSGFVQRKDYSALANYLNPKYEYVLNIRLTPLQIKIYRHYLDTMTSRGNDATVVSSHGKQSSLFYDYHNLMRVWTHPKALLLHTLQKEREEMMRPASSSEEEELSTEGEELDDEWSFANEEETPKKNRNGRSKKTSNDDEKPNETEELNDDEKPKETEELNDDEKPNETEELNDDEKPKETEELNDGEEPNETEELNYDETPIEKEELDDDEPEMSCRSSTEEESSKEENNQSFSSGSEQDSDDEELLPTKSQRWENRNRSTKYRLRGVDEDDHEDEEVEEEVSTDWYSELLPEDMDSLESYQNSSKIAILFEILRLAEEHQDKVLVFSQSLTSLDVIEYMLSMCNPPLEEEGPIHGQTTIGKMNLNPTGTGVWYRNLDYFRMDGSSLGHHRQRWINSFNDENEMRSRLFLISTKAGSLGVNLVGANRVVIFDACWNPTHDTQSMFRVYRFGQKKTCYIYRFIAEGTMEEKIYQRQVIKQSLANRVVDEQQINRYFTSTSLAEMYSFNPTTPDPEKTETPVVPKDKILADILLDPRMRHLIASFHEHDSLLDHQVQEELTEEERKSAWEEYENDKNRRGPAVLQDRGRNTYTSSEPRLNFDRLSASDLLILVTKVKKMMQDAFIKIKSHENKPVPEIINQLRSNPLYVNTSDDILAVIAKEVNFRLSIRREEATLQLTSLQMQYKILNNEYSKRIAAAELTTQPFIPSKESLLNQLASTSTSQDSIMTSDRTEENSSENLEPSTSKTEIIEISDDEQTA